MKYLCILSLMSLNLFSQYSGENAVGGGAQFGAANGARIFLNYNADFLSEHITGARLNSEISFNNEKINHDLNLNTHYALFNFNLNSSYIALRNNGELKKKAFTFGLGVNALYRNRIPTMTFGLAKFGKISGVINFDDGTSVEFDNKIDDGVDIAIGSSGYGSGSIMFGMDHYVTENDHGDELKSRKYQFKFGTNKLIRLSGRDIYTAVNLTLHKLKVENEFYQNEQNKNIVSIDIGVPLARELE